MSSIQPGVQGVMTCAHADCAASAAGHALSAIRARAAAATPSKWRDGVVAVVDGNWIAIEHLDGERTWSWHHEPIDAHAGDPVALHAVYNVLAVGAARFSVLPAAL